MKSNHTEERKDSRMKENQVKENQVKENQVKENQTKGNKRASGELTMSAAEQEDSGKPASSLAGRGLTWTKVTKFLLDFGNGVPALEYQVDRTTAAEADLAL